MPNSSMIKVRQLIRSEGDIYRQFRLEALKNVPDAFGSSYEAEAAWPLSRFEERIASGNVFGAFDHNKIIGMAGFYQQLGLKQNHKGVLWGMYVNPDYRKTGTGKKLIQAIIENATDIVDLITLSVVEGNEPAITLYSNMGFQIYGTEPRSLKTGTRYFSQTLMVCDLN